MSRNSLSDLLRCRLSLGVSRVRVSFLVQVTRSLMVKTLRSTLRVPSVDSIGPSVQLIVSTRVTSLLAVTGNIIPRLSVCLGSRLSMAPSVLENDVPQIGAVTSRLLVPVTRRNRLTIPGSLKRVRSKLLVGKLCIRQSIILILCLRN